MWSDTRCLPLKEGGMKQVLKREITEFKRMKDFCHTHPTFLYEGVPIRRAVLAPGKALGCALTFNLTMYKKQLRNGSAWILNVSFNF